MQTRLSVSVSVYLSVYSENRNLCGLLQFQSNATRVFLDSPLFVFVTAYSDHEKPGSQYLQDGYF